ncbi:methyltransferase domain-containing protein [Microbacteriaceae bacterium VKM Ac-2854]|nr:methyltransferase domain-containing protein [Microbacteriaceae bacterium VKM Ac-2854]
MVQVDRGAHLTSGDWLESNRAYWEERAVVDRTSADPPAIEGEPRVLILQSGDGADAVTLARHGARVVGLDFAMPAVRRARAAAAGLDARFVCANLYDARHMLPEPDSFDVVLSSSSGVSWLPDVAEWARIVEWFVAPGGAAVVTDPVSEPVAGGTFRWPRPFAELVAALRATGLRVDGEPVSGPITATKPAG